MNLPLNGMTAKKLKRNLLYNHILSAIAAVVLVCLYGLAGLQFWESRLENARGNMLTIASNARRHTQLLFETISREMDEPIAAAQSLPLDSVELKEVLIQARGDRHYIRNISILDDLGDMKNTSRIPSQGLGRNFSFRSYFRNAPLQESMPPYLGQVIESQIDSSFGISLSRAFLKDGRKMVINFFLDAQYILPEGKILDSGSIRAALYNSEKIPVLIYPWEDNRDLPDEAPYPFDMDNINLIDIQAQELPTGFLSEPIELEGFPVYWVFFQDTQLMLTDFILDYLGLSPFVFVLILLIFWLDYRTSKRMVWEWKTLLRESQAAVIQNKLRQELQHRVKNNIQVLNSLLSLKLDQNTEDGPLGLMVLWLQGLLASHESIDDHGAKSGVNLGKFLENLHYEWETHSSGSKSSLLYKTLAINLTISPRITASLALLLMEVFYAHSFKDGTLEMDIVFLESVNTLNFQIRGLNLEKQFIPSETIKALLSGLRGGYFYDAEWQQLNLRIPLGLL
jgi:two-component sensor histidine kinase